MSLLVVVLHLNSPGITKCDRLLLQNGSGVTKSDKLHYKVSVSGIAKFDSYYEVRRNTPKVYFDTNVGS